jgi:hypothetical protein
MKKIYLFLTLLFSGWVAYSQTSEDNVKEKAPFLEGSIGLRTFWMSTTHQDDFKNDFALGQALFLQSKTQTFKGFSLSGRYAFFGKVWSSDLSGRDPVTGNPNRYEVGLFDVTNPKDKFFGKLEEFQIRYTGKNFSVNAGRMEINTPFVNPQDGRLSPTFVEGIHLASRLQKNQLNWYLINRVSPRSTSSWYSVGDSFGLYPEGQGVLGGPSGYYGHTKSSFIHILDYKRQLPNNLQLQFNHTYVANISGTYFSQLMKDWKKGDSGGMLYGLQFTVQHGAGDGGNPDSSKRYKDPADLNWVGSLRIGWRNDIHAVNFNYTRIGGEGRFLNPREWGRDPFFTFIPRERNEGFNKLNAFTLQYTHYLPQNGLQLYTIVGLHLLPEPLDTRNNKYAMPTYSQQNLGIRYVPSKSLKGLDLNLLIMSKQLMAKGEMRPQWIYNKVNLFHINVIANYYIPW